ncbi:Probable protein phosphatase 2C 34 [Linum grandiflorum]
MVLFPSFFNGLARTVSMKKGKPSEDQKDIGKEAAEELAKDAKRNELILSSSGTVSKSNKFASVFSRRGQKGVNQDCLVVWEEFGCQDDMMLCGVFDGHGPWGHMVSKRVRETLPQSLLCNWQETLKASIDMEMELGLNDHHPHDHRHRFEIWKESYLKTYAAVDQQLKHHPKIDTFSSGSTALTIVKQGEHLMIANVGDSRAVLGTTSENGTVTAVQLTVDCKPNLPEEAERIKNSKGRIFCLPDEPGVYRIWRPSGKTPGLALSRAFGDYCIKDFGLISTPEVTQLRITDNDQFVILATDGVWDVVSNQEAVRVVSSAAVTNREKSAKRLVEFAARAWKRKRNGIAMDDMSAICLFFHRIDDDDSAAAAEPSMIVSASGDQGDADADAVKKNGSE